MVRTVGRRRAGGSDRRTGTGAAGTGVATEGSGDRDDSRRQCRRSGANAEPPRRVLHDQRQHLRVRPGVEAQHLGDQRLRRGAHYFPRGDRIAYDHDSEDRKSGFIWSIPINPTTGAATGPAQRVSVREGDESSFSPDGKLLAFEAFEGSPHTKHLLAVVPATGGPERVLGEYDNINETSWSADGKWIFVLLGNRQLIERVPAAGGPSERVISTSGYVTGPIDGQVAFYQDARAQSEGRVAYTTTSGAHGEFRIPPGSAFGSWAGNHIDPAQSLLRKTENPVTAHILNLADGTVRDVLPGALNGRAAVWSPDGSRLALQDSTGGHDEITVMNVDGSQPHRYPITVTPSSPVGNYMRWSPNGQMLAYYPSFKITLAVLDLATGKSRVVSSAPPNGVLPDFFWRPDGKSIVLVKDPARLGDSQGEVYEAGLDGTERKLRDIGAGLGSSRRDAYLSFISDQLLLVSATSSSERFLIPTSGKTAQRLPGTGRRWGSMAVSSDGGWLMFVPRDDGQPNMSVELMTSGGDSLRTLRLPFHPTCCWQATFTPDGVIIGGETPGEKASKFFLVPLNGAAPRVLSEFPGRTAEFSGLTGIASLSPTGKALLFTTRAVPTSTFYELDLTTLLQSVGKR